MTLQFAQGHTARVRGALIQALVLRLQAVLLAPLASLDLCPQKHKCLCSSSTVCSALTLNRNGGIRCSKRLLTDSTCFRVLGSWLSQQMREGVPVRRPTLQLPSAVIHGVDQAQLATRELTAAPDPLAEQKHSQAGPKARRPVACALSRAASLPGRGWGQALPRGWVPVPNAPVVQEQGCPACVYLGLVRLSSAPC